MMAFQIRWWQILKCAQLMPPSVVQSSSRVHMLINDHRIPYNRSNIVVKCAVITPFIYSEGFSCSFCEYITSFLSSASVIRLQLLSHLSTISRTAYDDHLK